MTAYEIIMIIIGMIGLPISVCSLLLALLTFLDKRNKHKLKKSFACETLTRRARSLQRHIPIARVRIIGT